MLSCPLLLQLVSSLPLSSNQVPWEYLGILERSTRTTSPLLWLAASAVPTFSTNRLWWTVLRMSPMRLRSLQMAFLPRLIQLRRSTFPYSFTRSGLYSAAALALYTNATAVTAAVEPILPMVDAASGVIDGQFVDLIQNGNLPVSGIPIMMGNVQDESVSQPYLLPALADIVQRLSLLLLPSHPVCPRRKTSLTLSLVKPCQRPRLTW